MIGPTARAVSFLLLLFDAQYPSLFRFNKGICLPGRCLLKGTGLHIDNYLYRTRNSYYKHTRLAMSITKAVRDLRLLASNSHLTPRWKSETCCTYIVTEISQNVETGISLYQLTESKNSCW